MIQHETSPLVRTRVLAKLWSISYQNAMVDQLYRFDTGISSEWIANTVVTSVHLLFAKWDLLEETVQKRYPGPHEDYLMISFLPPSKMMQLSFPSC